MHTTDAKVAFAQRFPVHVGVDCGRTFHQLVARGADGTREPALRVTVSRAGFDEALAYLARRFPTVAPNQTLVGLEFAGHHGFTFARCLARHGYQVVSVLPYVTKRLKDLEDNSPRKDDAKDAAQICHLLGQGLFVAYPQLDACTTELRVLATERRRLGVEETRLKNRLHAALDLAWPEFPTYFADLGFETPVALLTRWPLPEDLVAASARSVGAVAKRSSRNHVTAARVRAIRASARTSIALDTGTSARRAEMQRLLERWRLVRAQIAAVEARLGELVAASPAARALTTVPGISIVCAATLVAEVGDPHGYASPRQVLKLAGMNLVRRQSGTSVLGRVRQTKRGRPLLRRQLFLLAGRWCQPTGLYRAQYERMLRQGKSRTNAVCAIARKLVPLVLRVMQTAAPFDHARWTADRRTPAAA